MIEQQGRIQTFNASLLGLQERRFRRHLECDFVDLDYLGEPSITAMRETVKLVNPDDMGALASGLQKRGMWERILPQLGLEISDSERRMIDFYEIALSNFLSAPKPAEQIRNLPSVKDVRLSLGNQLKRKGDTIMANQATELEFTRVSVKVSIDRMRFANRIRVWFDVSERSKVGQLNYCPVSALSLAGIATQTSWDGQASDLEEFCRNTVETMTEFGEWAEGWIASGQERMARK